MAHLPRVVRWSAVEGATCAAADAVADASLQIGNCKVSPVSEDDMCARAQLELPMRHGGMGLHRLSPVEGSAVFLSSAALTHVAMEGAPAQFRPFDGPTGQGFRQEWQTLCHHVDLEDPGGTVVDHVCLRHVLPQAQKDTSRTTATSYLRSLTALKWMEVAL